VSSTRPRLDGLVQDEGNDNVTDFGQAHREEVSAGIVNPFFDRVTVR
jgi:hypothetical protein